RQPSADRLSDGAHPRRQFRFSRFRVLPARARRPRAVRGAGLYRARPRAVTALLSFSPEELTAIRLSLRVAFWAMLCSLPVGVAMALLLARGRFWGRSLLNAIVHLPLVMPPVVTGYLLLLLFGRKGPLGRLLA